MNWCYALRNSALQAAKNCKPYVRGALRTVSEYYTQQRYINSIIQFYERIERERSH